MNNLTILKKFCIILISIPLMMTISRGQESRIITPSPDASSLVRSVNLPVDQHTGVANIHIPLFTVGTGKIRIPVSLHYQASGIKVHPPFAN